LATVPSLTLKRPAECHSHAHVHRKGSSAQRSLRAEASRPMGNCCGSQSDVDDGPTSSGHQYQPPVPSRTNKPKARATGGRTLGGAGEPGEGIDPRAAAALAAEVDSSYYNCVDGVATEPGVGEGRETCESTCGGQKQVSATTSQRRCRDTAGAR